MDIKSLIKQISDYYDNRIKIGTNTDFYGVIGIFKADVFSFKLANEVIQIYSEVYYYIKSKNEVHAEKFLTYMHDNDINKLFKKMDGYKKPLYKSVPTDHIKQKPKKKILNESIRKPRKKISLKEIPTKKPRKKISLKELPTKKTDIQGYVTKSGKVISNYSRNQHVNNKDKSVVAHKKKPLDFASTEKMAAQFQSMSALLDKGSYKEQSQKLLDVFSANKYGNKGHGISEPKITGKNGDIGILHDILSLSIKNADVVNSAMFGLNPRKDMARQINDIFSNSKNIDIFTDRSKEVEKIFQEKYNLSTERLSPFTFKVKKKNKVYDLNPDVRKKIADSMKSTLEKYNEVDSLYGEKKEDYVKKEEIDDLLANTEDIVDRVSKAKKDGVPQEKIDKYIEDSFIAYTANETKPFKRDGKNKITDDVFEEIVDNVFSNDVNGEQNDLADVSAKMINAPVTGEMPTHEMIIPKGVRAGEKVNAKQNGGKLKSELMDRLDNAKKENPEMGTELDMVKKKFKEMNDGDVAANLLYFNNNGDTYKGSNMDKNKDHVAFREELNKNYNSQNKTNKTGGEFFVTNNPLEKITMSPTGTIENCNSLFNNRGDLDITMFNNNLAAAQNPNDFLMFQRHPDKPIKLARQSFFSDSKSVEKGSGDLYSWELEQLSSGGENTSTDAKTYAFNDDIHKKYLDQYHDFGIKFNTMYRPPNITGENSIKSEITERQNDITEQTPKPETWANFHKSFTASSLYNTLYI